jgi:DNA-binding transcriptional MerR regulator
MTIGEFAQRSRLSPKALRLYDQLGLLVPADTDPASGYRFYRDEQVERARTVGLLRRLDMPLAMIAELLDAAPAGAVKLLGDFWEQVETTTAERRALVSYLKARLTGGNVPNYEIQTRHIADRQVVSITRHLHASETDAFFDEAFSRLGEAGPGLQGIDGAPYLIFYGEVSDDSDGPIELCRPVGSQGNVDRQPLGDDVEGRLEAGHDEAYVRLSMAEMGWPAILPVVDALEAWTTSHQRRPGGALRQVLIADQRTATATTLVCDLTIPLA